MKTVLFAGVALAFATAGVAQSQAPATSPNQNSSRPTLISSGSEDIEFVLDAAKGGRAEVELGQLAAQRAQNDEVKKFAQRMVDRKRMNVNALLNGRLLAPGRLISDTTLRALSARYPNVTDERPYTEFPLPAFLEGAPLLHDSAFAFR